MPFLLIALFILVPIAELAIIIQVGQAIGVWWTIALLIADSVLGALLMRSQGRAAWRRFNEALGSGRAPAREVADGVLIIFGGALLLTPGFLSDIFGVALPVAADARGDPARVPPPGDPADDGLDARRDVPRRRRHRAPFGRPARLRLRGHRGRRRPATPGARQVSARRGRPPGRGDRQRHLRVRRRRRRSSTASRGSAAPPTGRAARCACSSPAASRWPRSPAAASRSRATGAGARREVAGLRATVDAPHARWSVTLRRRGRPGLRARVRRTRRAGRERARGSGGMAGYEQPCQVTGRCAPAGASARSPRSASAAARGATRTGTGSSSRGRSARGPMPRARR